MSTVLDEIRNETDLDAHPDSNIQHFIHMMEGYRSRIREGRKWKCPYSPGSARKISFCVGVDMAVRDLRGGDQIEL